MPPFRVPLATYRLQFNPQFGFRDAQELVEYLHQLGISDAYASPPVQVASSTIRCSTASNADRRLAILLRRRRLAA